MKNLREEVVIVKSDNCCGVYLESNSEFTGIISRTKSEAINYLRANRKEFVYRGKFLNADGCGENTLNVMLTIMNQ